MNGKKQLLSVVIPIYNREELAWRAIDSVMTQDLPDGWTMELIVVDDGSTDGTAAMLRRAQRERAGEGRRVRIVTREHTGTPGAVRNHGVALSEGECIAFLDSDDEWLPGKLLQQIPLHYEAGVDFSHTRERWIRNGREISQEGRRFSHRRSGDLLEDALVKCIIGPSTVMMTRRVWDATGGFRPDLEIAEDYEYWLRLVTITMVAYLDIPLTAKYAGHGDQLSEKYGHIERFRIEGLRELVESRWFSRNRGLVAQNLAQRELSRKARIYANGARKRGRTDEAQRYERLVQRDAGF